MHILFFNWDCYGKEDILETFQRLGHKVTVSPLNLRFHNKIDYDFVEKTKKEIEQQRFDAVFTLNYFSSVSYVCNEAQCRYLSWVYDSPFVRLYSADIINPCNYIFLFDKHTYLDLKEKGIETVYYMPLAVNSHRLRKIRCTKEEQELFHCDVSFIGSMYNESHNLYNRLVEKADVYTIGFLEGIIESQLRIYGYNFLEEVLTKEQLDDLTHSMNYALDEDSFATLSYVYANYFLCRKITSLERIRSLTEVSKQANTVIYTPNAKAQIGNAINRGPVDYYTTMPKIFQCSKINLNITLKSIQSGIPLRAMDILGVGGFLLSNYQADFCDCFVPYEDFVFYESMQDLLEKIDYYKHNESERLHIAENGHRKVKELHTYDIRLQKMLRISF